MLQKPLCNKMDILNSLHAGKFFKLFGRLAFKIIISKKSFRNTIKLLSSLDPDLGPNYTAQQKFSTDFNMMSHFE